MKTNWEVKKLGEVCEVVNRGVSPKYVETDGICVLNQKCIRDHEINYSLARLHDAESKKISSEKLIRIGDVLVNSTGTGTLGRVAQVRDIPPTATVDSHVTIVRPKTDLFYNDFFGYALVSLEEEIALRGEGCGGQTELARSTLKDEFKISYPKSHSEQQRIVAILDETFSAIDQAKANAQRNLQNARELFDSYLQSVFANPGEGWEEKTLEEVSIEMFAGGDAPKKNFSITKNESYTIPIYANAVKDNGLYGFTDFARVTKPSITIAARGSGTGHIELRKNAYFPIVRLIVIIPNLKIVDLSFLKFAVSTLKIVRSGSAIPQLTIPMIKDYVIPVPPLQEQQIIIAKLAKLSAETKKLEAIYQQKLIDLDELKKSILQKAFRGELSKTQGDALCVC